jgi:hypothetical protein
MRAADLTSARGQGAVIRQGNVRSLVLLSAACLSLQVVATDYGMAGGQAAAFWFIVGAGLLWLVYRRRNRVARVLVIVTSLLGALLYSLGAFDSGQAAVLSLAYLGQALPLMSRTVRLHTDSHLVSLHR